MERREGGREGERERERESGGRPADSILGVTLFAAEAPQDFAVFTRAFVTMFRVASGDPWPESLALVLEDGETNWATCAYMCSFIIIACWISLEVSVAVLLENFVAASRRMEEEEKLRHAGQRKTLSEFKNPMEPLLAKLATSFVDDADLSLKLKTVYNVRPQLPSIVPLWALPAPRLRPVSHFCGPRRTGSLFRLGSDPRSDLTQARPE